MSDPSIRITVRHDEENCGPYSLSDVNQLLLSDQLDRNDLAWVEGTPDWVPLRSISGVVNVPGKRENVSERKVLVAFLLAWFIGLLGIHRFYAGRTGSGIVMLLLTLTLAGVIVTSIWVLVDLIILACGNFRDGDGLMMKDWT